MPTPKPTSPKELTKEIVILSAAKDLLLSPAATLRAGLGMSCLAGALALLTPTLPAQTPTVETLRQQFLNPPPESRPMVRWWWFGPAVVKPEILKELQQMKSAGIGGAEMAFVYPTVLDDPAKGLKNLTFLSPEMLDDITYAQSEGRKLGLRIDITLCSGWPYGGPTITLADAVTRLRTAEVAIPAGATSVTVPALAPGKTATALGRTRFVVDGSPKLAEGDSIIAASIANSIVGVPVTSVPRGRNVGPTPIDWDATSAKPLQVSGATLTVAPSDVPRTALFFIQSHTGQEVKRAAVGAEGYVLDPFSKEAVATHLKNVGDPLIKAFGATPPYAIFSDSLEAYGADWTPNLPAEFKKRRGYDLIPHLPELIAGGTPAADNIRHDYGVTLTELVNENYLTQINDWAIAHHTKFRSQTYGEPAVSFSSQNLVSLAEGEGPQWRAWSTLRWATSANHVFNHEVTSGETFTWLHSPVFRAVPLDMKVEADIDFIMGENQLIFHGFPYSAPAGEVPEPGWSLYAAASFNSHNPWFPVLPTVNAYITRMSYLMRQGQSANQVVILLPTDDVWAGFHPTDTAITTAMGPHITPLMPAILSAGYNVDYIDADAINKVGLGTHQILVLPPTDRIPVETLHKLTAWVKTGGKVIAIGKLPTLTPDGKPLPSGAETSAIILIPDESQLAQALMNAAKPDFSLTTADDSAPDQLGFIRRKLPNADIYFVANTSNRPIEAVADFSTAHKNAEAWDPDTTTNLPIEPTKLGIFIHLAPYESRVFIFSDTPSNLKQASVAAPAKQLADLSSDWKVTFTSTGKSSTEPTPTNWIADPATIHYSGEVVYSRDFTLAASTAPVYLQIDGGKPLPGAPNSPPEHAVLGPDGLPNPAITRPGPGMHAYYDPPIREAALVTINGQPAGALWHPPYRLNISKLLKPGQNHIEIHVFNTALNAWSALPPHDYKPLIAKYGDRFQMQDLQQVQPISSGLLGPVHLITEGK